MGAKRTLRSDRAAPLRMSSELDAGLFIWYLDVQTVVLSLSKHDQPTSALRRAQGYGDISSRYLK
jgi:hypothetical protein